MVDVIFKTLNSCMKLPKNKLKFLLQKEKSCWAKFGLPRSVLTRVEEEHTGQGPWPYSVSGLLFHCSDKCALFIVDSLLFLCGKGWRSSIPSLLP